MTVAVTQRSEEIYALDVSLPWSSPECLANLQEACQTVSCFVVRSDRQEAVPAFHDDIFWPVPYDAKGSKTLLADYLYVA